MLLALSFCAWTKHLILSHNRAVFLAVLSLEFSSCRVSSASLALGSWQEPSWFWLYCSITTPLLEARALSFKCQDFFLSESASHLFHSPPLLVACGCNRDPRPHWCHDSFSESVPLLSTLPILQLSPVFARSARPLHLDPSPRTSLQGQVIALKPTKPAYSIFLENYCQASLL